MNKQTLLIFIATLGLVGAGGWYAYTAFSTQSGDAGIGSGIEETPETLRIEAELSKLRRLKIIELDTSVFKHPFLQTLQLPQSFNGSATTTGSPGTPNPFLTP